MILEVRGSSFSCLYFPPSFKYMYMYWGLEGFQLISIQSDINQNIAQSRQAGGRWRVDKLHEKTAGGLKGPREQETVRLDIYMLKENDFFPLLANFCLSALLFSSSFS